MIHHQVILLAVLSFCVAPNHDLHVNFNHFCSFQNIYLNQRAIMQLSYHQLQLNHVIRHTLRTFLSIFYSSLSESNAPYSSFHPKLPLTILSTSQVKTCLVYNQNRCRLLQLFDIASAYQKHPPQQLYLKVKFNALTCQPSSSMLFHRYHINSQSTHYKIH